MSIGQRITAWLKSFFFWSFIKTKTEEYQARNAEMLPALVAGMKRALENGDSPRVIMYAIVWGLYLFAGGGLWLPASITKGVESAYNELEEFQDNPQGYLREKLHQFGTSDETQAFAEFVGTIITEPVVSLLETYAGDDNPDPHAMARAFHGIASGLPWASTALDSILKAALGPRAPAAGQQIQSIYWGLGLGFLGWQTLAPLLSSGLQPNLERYYNRLYRPKRFSASEVRDLFALGKINAATLNDLLRDEGWKDNDIQTWLELSYRNLSEGVIWELYEKNLLSQAQVEVRLRAAGYNPDDIPLVFQAHPKTEEEEPGKFLRSTAKAAFKSHLIDENEFRQILTTLKYAQREIDLQVATLTEEKEVELKELTVSQIKSLYVARLIDQIEAQHHLQGLDISPTAIGKLIELWDNESIPKPVRLNRSTITSAYREGVIDRGKANTLLQSEAGYDSEQADLVLQTVDAYLVRIGTPVSTGPKAISLTMLRQFAQAGLITRGEAEARTELDQFASEDRPLIVDYLFFQAFEEPLELAVEQLAQAYVFGLIDRAQLAARLEAKGIVAADIELYIREVELNAPEVFGEFADVYVRVPTIGQLDLALQRGVINETEYRERLSKMGFKEEGISIYLFNAQYQTPVEPKKLSDANVLNLYELGKITRANALDRLVQNGYILDDAKLLIEAREVLPADTEIVEAWEAGYIDIGAVLAVLTDMGFSEDAIQAWVVSIGGL